MPLLSILNKFDKPFFSVNFDHVSEVSLGPCQTSYRWTGCGNISILHVLQGPKCASLVMRNGLFRYRITRCCNRFLRRMYLLVQGKLYVQNKVLSEHTFSNTVIFFFISFLRIFFHYFRVDFMIPEVSTVGGYSMCSAPTLLKEKGVLHLAVKYAKHPPAHWIHTKVICSHSNMWKVVACL